MSKSWVEVTGMLSNGFTKIDQTKTKKKNIMSNAVLHGG